MKVVELKALAKECGLRGYSRLKKTEPITFLQNNLRPTPAPRPTPALRPPLRLIPTPRPPPRPISAPRQIPAPRPPPRPLQLKPKRGKETFIELPMKQEPPSSNQKQIKRMKKKLGKLNKKIRHSKKKHNNLISKRNSIKKKVEELKGPREPEGPRKPFNPIELEQAFNRAYRSYRINGRSRMDVDAFFDRIRQNLINLINRELKDLGSAKVQRTIWIRFIQALEDDFGNIIGSDRVEKAFNSMMTEIHQGSNLDEIINEMLTHMIMQIENPALVNSRFVFYEVLFLDLNFYQLDLTRGSSYIPLPDWIAN